MQTKQFRFLEVKALDEDQRVITGIATTPGTDRMGDIVDPMGAKYASEIPFLWQHEHDKPVGTCKLGKPTAKGIPFEARLPKIAEEGKFDLIIMGTHGHGSLGKLVMGSVSTQVLANSQVPVLLVR